MNRRRGLVIGVGLLAALAVVGVGLALSSGVQTYLVRRVLNEQPGVEATLERVSIRPGALHLQGLTYRQGGVTLRVPRIDSRISLWQLVRGRAQLDDVVAHGWELEVEPPAAEPQVALTATYVDDESRWSQASTDWAAAFGHLAGVLAVSDGTAVASGLAGWLELLNLPVELDLGRLDLKGSAVWRDAGPGADGNARVEVSGGGIRVGQRGAIVVTIDAEGDRASAAGIQSLNIQSSVEVGMLDAATINLLKVSAEIDGRRDGQLQPDHYVLELSLETMAGAPRVSVSLRDERSQLLSAQLSDGGVDEDLTGRWSMALDDVSLRSLMLGRTLPIFSMSGQGSLNSSRDLGTASVDGELKFSAEDLGVIRSELGAIGQLSGVIAFDAEMRDAAYRVTQFDVVIDGAAPVLAARLLQGIEWARESAEVRVSRPAEPVLSLELLGVPASWAQPWLAPLVIDAQSVKGAMVALVTPRGVRVITTQDLSIVGLVAAKEGETLLDDLDVAMRLGAEVTDEGWQVELDRLDLADDHGVLLSLSARGGRLMRENDVMKLAGRIEADVNILQHVPLASQNLTLSAGRLEGEFGLGVEERVSLAATLHASNLSVAGGETLPDMQFDGRIDLHPDGGLEAHLPMRFTQEERVSDLTLNVIARPQNGAWLAEGSLSGPRAFVSDLQGLALIVAVAPVADESPQTRTGDAALVPVWAGWTGTFKTAIGELTLPNGIALQNVRGDLLIEQQKVNLSGVRADVVSGGSVQIEGVLGFDPAQAKPYRATGALEAEGVEMGPLLRIMDPAKLPPLEGRLNVSAQLQSAMVELDELAANSSVSARVTSAGGVLRALQVDVQQYIQTGRTIAAVGGLFAALSGNKKVGDQAQRLQALITVAEQLSALSFDQLNLELNRAPQGDLELRDLSVITPGVRLLGNGSIHYAENLPWLLSPLLLNLKVGAREEMGMLLAQLNLVQAEADTLGYRPLIKDVTLDGSLQSVGTAELSRLLSRALSP